VKDGPFELPTHWRWATFSDVARVAADLVDPTQTPHAPHIAPNHIESWTGTLLPYKTIGEDGMTSAKHRFHKGQILYSKIRPYLAKVALASFDGLCSADMYPIETDLEPAFLLRWMLTPTFTNEASSSQGRTVLPKINRDALARLHVPVAPPNEQRRIVAKLDAIFEQTRAAKARLELLPALLDKLKRSILAAGGTPRLYFESGVDEIPSTWRWETLQDLVVAGGIFDGARDHGSGTAVAQNLRTADYTESGVRVIRLENLAHLTFIEEKRTFISAEKFNGLKQNEVREGDLLFGSFIDEQVRVCRLPRLDAPAIAKADCFCVRPDLEKVLPEYLLLQLACQRTRDSIESQAHGLGRLRITTKQLRAIRVPLCSMSEQQQIVDKVTSQFSLADHMLRRIQTGIQQINEVERAALAKAFRGELVEQDPRDEPASALLERLRAVVNTHTNEGAANPRGRVTRAKSQDRTALAETES